MTRSNDAVGRLDERYRRPLLRFFFRKVRDLGEAEDLTQDVFLRVLQRPDAAEIGATDAFIFTVAANLLKDRARRAAAHGGGARVSWEGRFNNRTYDHWEPETIGDEGIDPERVLIGRETLCDLLKALDGLSTNTRDIFLLFRLEGMKQREIADIYGISVSAVEKHIAKALKRIVEHLPPR